MLNFVNAISDEEMSNVNGGAGNSNYFEYLIKSGDNLSKIASKYETTVNKLIEINGLANPNCIKAGQKLLVPYKKPKY